MIRLAVIAFILTLPLAAAGEEVGVRRRFRPDMAEDREVLVAGDMEPMDPLPDDAPWMPWRDGFKPDDQVARSGRYSLRVQTNDRWQVAGAVQEVEIRAESPHPLLFSGWSRCRDLRGPFDQGYSLRVEVIYAGGDGLREIYIPFRDGTHDWEMSQRWIVPDRPVERVRIYCALSQRTGAAWFDDISIREYRSADGIIEFDHLPLSAAAPPSLPPVKGDPVCVEGPSLRVALDPTGGSVLYLATDAGTLRGRPFGLSGLFVRDVTKGSDIFPARGAPRRTGSDVRIRGEAPEIEVSVDAQWKGKKDHILLEGAVRSGNKEDRCLTLYLTLPLEASMWQVCTDAGREVVMDRYGAFRTESSVPFGAAWSMARYPLVSLAAGDVGVAVGVPPDQPQFPRLGYNASTGEVYVALDIGISAAAGKPRGSAPFSILLFAFPPDWGWRAAFDTYHRIYADLFRPTDRETALWANQRGEVMDWRKDWGPRLRIREGGNLPEASSMDRWLRRTAPPQIWIGREPGPTLTPDFCRDILQRLTKDRENTNARDSALLSLAAGVQMADGQVAFLIPPDPQADHFEVLINRHPSIPCARGAPASPSEWCFDARGLSAEYGRGSGKGLSGEFLGWVDGVAVPIDFHPEHLARCDTPLLYRGDELRPGVSLAASNHAFQRWVSRGTHKMRGKTAAFGLPGTHMFLTDGVDILLHSADWRPEERYQPWNCEEILRRRAWAGLRTSQIVLGTRLRRWSDAQLEDFYRRCTAFGFFPALGRVPGEDRAMWEDPESRERLAPLLDRYLPIVQTLAQAGWEPIPGVRCADSQLGIERFSAPRSKSFYLTLYNAGDSSVTEQVRLESGILGIRGKAAKITGVYPPGNTYIPDAAGDDWTVPVDILPGELEVWIVKP